MVEPVTIAVLGGLGALATSMSGWFAARSAKKRREKEKKRTAHHHLQDPGPKRPSDLPVISLPEAGVKWMLHVRRLLEPKIAAAPTPPPAPAKKSATARVVAVLNGLEPLFQASVLILLVWFLSEPLLARVRPDLVSAVPSWAILLVTAGAVGYGTNWIALKMLFHPQRRNLVWRGVIPDRKAQLVEAISNSVIERLVGPDIIRRYLHESELLRDVIIHANKVARKVISDHEFRQDVKAILYDAVSRFAASDETKDAVAKGIEEKIRRWTGTDLGARLATAFKTVWGPFVKREILRALPDLPKAVEHAFGRIDGRLMAVPDWLEAREGKIEEAIAEWVSILLNRIDFKPIIVGELRKMSPDQLEAMLSNPLSAELRFVKTSGGLFGLAVAAATQWLPARLVLLALTMILFLVYRWTVQPLTIEAHPRTPKKKPSG